MSSGSFWEGRVDIWLVLPLNLWEVFGIGGEFASVGGEGTN